MSTDPFRPWVPLGMNSPTGEAENSYARQLQQFSTARGGVPLGMNSDVGEAEWNTFLRRRQQLIDDGMKALGLTSRVHAATGAQPEAAFRASSLLISQDPNSFIQQSAPRGVQHDYEYSRLLGAARFYGIENAETMDPQQLEALIQQQRVYLQDRRTGEPRNIGQELYDTFASFLGVAGLGSVDALVQGIKHIPFVGDAVAKSEAVRNYQQGLAMLEEGFTGDMLDNERASYEKYARPLSHFLGYSALVGTASEAVGATGFARGVSNPLVRGALQGGATGWLVEGGGDEPVNERALMIAGYAGFGAVVEWGLPKLMARLSRSFPRAGDPVYNPQMRPVGHQPPTVDAEWYFVDEPLQITAGGQAQLEGYVARPFGGPPVSPAPRSPGAPPNILDEMWQQTVGAPAEQAARRAALEQDLRALTVSEATADAVAATKQGTILESPALPAFAKQPVLEDADVAIASIASNPGQISVVRDVGDASKTIRRFLQETIPSGVGPQDFRAIQRPDGRTDILVADGRTITNRMAKDYQQYGLFSGQQATTNGGQQVTVVALGPEFSQVRMLGGIEVPVPTAELMPGKASLIADAAPEAYTEFRSYALSRMADETLHSGAPVHTIDWFSEELASQLPRYIGEFLDLRGVEGQALRGVYTSSFTEARLQDLRSLAPEEFAHAEAVQQAANQEFNKQIVTGGRSLSLSEAAETKGLAWSPAPNSMGGTLTDLVSGAEVPVESVEAGFRYIHDFNRELPDYSPFSVASAELAAGPSGSANPGASLGPERYASEIDVTENGHRALNRIEKLSAESDNPFEQTPYDFSSYTQEERDAFDAWWESLGRTGIDANAVSVHSVGGGGRIPPSGPPPAIGGSFDPFQRPLSLPGAATTLGEQFAGLRASAPGEYDALLNRFDGMALKILEPMRNWALNVEQALHQGGITEGKMWQHYSDVVNARAVAHNEAIPWHRQINDTLAMIRRRFIRDGTVTIIGEMPRDQALHAMQNAGYSAREMQGQMQLRDILEQLRQEYGVGQIMDYMPHLRARAMRGEDLGNLNQMFGGNNGFFAEQVRSGAIDVREMNASILLHRWVRAASFYRYVAQPTEVMRQAWVADPRVPMGLRQITSDWLDLVTHGHTPGQDILVPGIRHTLNAVGVPVTNAEVARGLNFMMTTLYRGALGGRPDVILRDMIGPLFGGTRTGFAPLARSYMQFFKGGAGRQEMLDLALRGGWVERGMMPMGASEMFQTQMGMVPGTPVVETTFSPLQEQLRGGAARVGDAMRDALPEGLRSGMQGTWADPLRFYQKEGEFNRLISGHSGYMLMRDAIEAFDAARTAVPEADMTRLLGQLMRQSGADAYAAPIQRRIAELALSRQYEDAAFVYANEVANSQFRYGTAEQSLAIRSSGAVGRFGSTFGTFTTQYIAQTKEAITNTGLAPEFGGTSTDRVISGVKFLARQSTVAAALGLATGFTGWNLGKWYWHGSLGFGGGPMLLALIMKIQEETGKFNQAQGEPLTPAQKAAVLQSHQPNSYDVLSPSTLNPYAGTMRTLQSLTQTVQSANPLESTAQFIVTGKRGSGDATRFFNDAPYQLAPPPPWVDPNFHLQGGGTPQQVQEIVRAGGGAIQ